MSDQVDLKGLDAHQGMTLDYRRGGTDWPATWRCRVIANKNERSSWRVVGYGDTAQGAIDSVRLKLDCEREEWGRRGLDLRKAFDSRDIRIFIDEAAEDE